MYKLQLMLYTVSSFVPHHMSTGTGQDMKIWMLKYLRFRKELYRIIHLFKKMDKTPLN